jgi:hypothetical protein
VAPISVGDETKTCEAAFIASGVDENRGCQQFRDRFFQVGSPLVAPQEGLGLHRQSPEARRLFVLAQAGVDGGDPINFAPYYALRRAPGIDGALLPPRPVYSFSTAGDPFVPPATSYAFARAAGGLPFLPTAFVYTHPEWAAYATPRELYAALGDRTPNDILISSGTMEGVARLGRQRANASCKPNYVSGAACSSAPSASGCEQTLYDVDWLAEGKNLWDAPRPAIPLRLARAADVDITDAASLNRAWEPRLRSMPLGGDAGGWSGAAPLIGAINAWIQPGGQHVFVNPDPCKAFDDVLYYDNLLVRYLATEGRELVFLQKPGSHQCLVREDCSFFPTRP